MGNLDTRANQRDLEIEFERYGRIQNIWLARKPPGFGFVEFFDPRDAQDAVRGSDGRYILDKRVTVEISNRGGSGGGGGAGGGGPPPVQDQGRGGGGGGGYRDNYRGGGGDYGGYRDRDRDRDGGGYGGGGGGGYRDRDGGYRTGGGGGRDGPGGYGDSGPRGRSGSFGRGDMRGGRDFRDPRDGRDAGRANPRRTEHRVKFTGLSASTRWQELKDACRGFNLIPVYCDLCPTEAGTAYADFQSEFDANRKWPILFSAWPHIVCFYRHPHRHSRCSQVWWTSCTARL